MRELLVRLRFVQPCLGDALDRQFSDGRRTFARDVEGRVVFLAAWHRSNMVLAARLLGRHHGEVGKIRWDVAVDAVLARDRWFHRPAGRPKGKGRGARNCVHESFAPGDEIGIGCAVPDTIPDDDFHELMAIAGRLAGLSPWRDADFGRYVVVALEARRTGRRCSGSTEASVANPVNKND